MPIELPVATIKADKVFNLVDWYISEGVQLESKFLLAVGFLKCIHQLYSEEMIWPAAYNACVYSFERDHKSYLDEIWIDLDKVPHATDTSTER